MTAPAMVEFPGAPSSVVGGAKVVGATWEDEPAPHPDETDTDGTTQPDTTP